MRVRPAAIPEVLVLEPEVHRDGRGLLFESFHRGRFEAALGRRLDLVQDNQVRSARGVLRGLHYQRPHPQAKLVRALRGAVWDVAVDLRRGSPTCGRWVAEELSDENRRQLWIPEGFAHGFLALTDGAEVLYRATAHHHPEAERCLRWDDPALAIPWPTGGAAPILSPRDAAAAPLAEAPLFEPGEAGP